MTITPGELGPTAKSQGQPDGSVLMNGLTGGLGKPPLPKTCRCNLYGAWYCPSCPSKSGIVLGVFYRGYLPWEGISKGLSWFGSGCSWNLSQHGSSVACPRQTGDVLQKGKSAELTKPVCVSKAEGVSTEFRLTTEDTEENPRRNYTGEH